MAKHLDLDHSEEDKIKFIRWKVEPNTLLKLRASSEIEKTDIFCSRIHHHVETKKNSISENQILILSTSKDSISNINLTLDSKFKKKQNIDKFTFKEIISNLINKKYKNWKILDEYEVKRIEELLIKQSDTLKISYTKLKSSIGLIGAVSIKSLENMNKDELLVRFGMDKEDSLKLKKIVGNDFYLTYSQLIEEAKNLPNLIKLLEKYKYIFIANFHNLMEGEAEFISEIGKGKHITVMANDITTVKPKLFEMNWNNINSNYSNANLFEVNLKNKRNNGVKVSSTEYIKYQTKIYQKSTQTVKNESATYVLDQILSQKISSSNNETIVDIAMSILENKRSDRPFLQLMSLIPGFDESFLKEFCKLVSSENNSIYDFLIKYQDSLSDKTKSKLLPILNCLSSVESTLIRTKSNSIMENILNIFKAANIDTKVSTSMKEQLHQLELWLKFLETHNDFKISDDLIECYINNKPSKSKFGSTKFVNLKDENTLNSTINFKLPVSVTMENSVSHITRSSIKIKTDDNPIKRSGSIKYTPRPRSWHAGNIFNAARKLR
ncbi:hypothetical protein C6P42_001657 [Pichia californica]|nr:hypothetical protein C6P42_001657 [[Candida] californica]